MFVIYIIFNIKKGYVIIHDDLINCSYPCSFNHYNCTVFAPCGPLIGQINKLVNL